jgi:hypothetical protein
MTSNDLHNTTQETKDRPTLTPPGGELRYSGGVAVNYCSMCGTRRVTLVTNKIVITTN